MNPSNYNQPITKSQNILYILGKSTTVVFDPIELVQNRPIVTLEDSILYIGGQKKISRCVYQNSLVEYFRGYAHKIFKKSLDYYTNQMELTYTNFRVSHARTRWGSCSSSRKISLNWQLIRLPQDVLDYVVIHELAHIIHMNHSQKFWCVVRDFCADYKEKREFLKSVCLSWGYNFWRM